MTGTFPFYNSRFFHRFHIILNCTIFFSNDICNLFLRQRWFLLNHFQDACNYGIIAAKLLNITIISSRLIVYSGIGFPASLQLSLIFSIPRPHASIKPALKNVLAINGLYGLDRCFPIRSSIVQSSGKIQSFAI